MSSATILDDVDIKLTSPAFLSGPDVQEFFAALRREDPVHWTDGLYPRPFWSVTKYEDCRAVLQNSELFSNQQSTSLPADGKEMSEETRRLLGWDVHIGAADPPVHTVMRRPLNKHFSVPAVARMHETCAQIIDEIIAEVSGMEEIDLVEDLCAKLPVRLVLSMLGIPESDWPYLRSLAHDRRYVQERALRDGSDPGKAMIEASGKVFEYCRDHVMKRRAEPTDDFASIIAAIQVGDRLMTDREAGWITSSIVTAGLEATRNSAVMGFMLFLRHPEFIPHLQEPSSAKLAVEEVLRWVSPSKHKLRVATADTEIRGRSIRKGDWVVPWLISANHDEDVFENPEEFNIFRADNPHLTFSVGTHTCLGRNLARLELQMLLPRVFAAFPDLAPAGEPDFAASNITVEVKRFPATLTRDSARALV